jgi:dihydroneopterin aldolase/2-amino-4-hydroxy-6-hydroxymethyldihydropteridine diphosphokinase
MTRLTINDLNFYSYIGVKEEEKKLGQWFSATLKIYFDFTNLHDNVENTINYSTISKKVIDIGVQTKCNLIETFATDLATYLMNEYDIITKIKVGIKKPNAPMKVHVDYVSAKVVICK